jgi:hypothetical protein
MPPITCAPVSSTIAFAAAVGELAFDARVGTEPELVPGEIDVAGHGAVQHDSLAVGAEVAADRAVDDHRAAGERRVAAHFGLRRDAKRPARHAQVAVHLSLEPHVAAGRVQIAPT